MDLPPDFFIESTLEVGVIYKLNAPELIETQIPHYFVVVAIDDQDNYMVICTTQLTNKLNYFRRNGIDERTLAYITPNDDNGLTDNTYINCNDYYEVDRDSLIDKLKNGNLEYTGNISMEEYGQIKYSINLSSVNDLPEHLLNYPDKEE